MHPLTVSNDRSQFINLWSPPAFSNSSGPYKTICIYIHVGEHSEDYLTSNVRQFPGHVDCRQTVVVTYDMQVVIYRVSNVCQVY